MFQRGGRFTTVTGEQDVVWGLMQPGQVPSYNATTKTLEGKVDQVALLTAQQPITTTGLATITGLSVSLPDAGTYYFRSTLLVTQSALTVVGYGIAVSAGFTSCSFLVTHPRSATTLAYSALTTAQNTAVQDTRTTAALTLPVMLEGSIVVSASGTLSIQAQRATVNTVTVEVGSSLWVLDA